MIQEQSLSPAERRRVAEGIARDAGWPSLEAMRAAMRRIPRDGIRLSAQDVKRLASAKDREWRWR